MADDNFEYKMKDDGADFLGGPIKTPLGGGLGFSKNKYKKFIVPVGIIVAIIVVYKLLNWYSSSPTPSKQEQELAQKNNASAATVATQPVVPPTPSADQLVMQQNEAMRQKIDTLSQQIQTMQSVVSTLNDSVTQNKTDIQSLSKSIETINASILDMNKNTQVIYSMVKKPVKSKRYRSWARFKPIYYHVKAIVPGRVWLESSEGSSVSLKVGDRLNGFGSVKSIDPDNGIVIMSSGTIFKYGRNDH